MKKNILLLVSLLAVSAFVGCGNGTNSSATVTPATETPATQTPATEAPATEAPKTEAPATEAPTADITAEPTEEPTSEPEPVSKYSPLADENYNQNISSYDMHDLYVSTSAVVPCLTCSFDTYYSYPGYDSYFKKTSYAQYAYGDDTANLYINVNAVNSYFYNYSMKDYYGYYPTYFQGTDSEGAPVDYYQQLVAITGEDNKYTAVTEEIAAILDNIGVAYGWGTGYGAYFASTKTVTDYYQILKDYCDANADEEGYAPLTEEIREDLQAISKVFWRSTGYYQYFTFFSTEETPSTGYEALCDATGSTKTCKDDAKAYISVNDNYEYTFTNGNILFAGVDMATYYSWYPSMFTSVGVDYYAELIDLIGDTADGDGYALVTDEMHTVIDTIAHMLWTGDSGIGVDYCADLCFIKNDDGTFTEWESAGYPTDVDLYVNPTKGMEAIYTGGAYSIYDYRSSFVTAGTDYYQELLALIDGQVSENGYVEVTDKIEECLNAIGEIYFGAEGDYGYEFMFVQSADVVNE